MESGKFFKVRKGLSVIGSGSTVVDVKGSKGQIFSINDTLSDSLFSVNDFSGIPILEVFNNDTVKIGTYNNQGLIVNEDKVEIGNKLTVKGEISSSGSLYLENGENKYITTNTFAPDFGGFGARLETGISGSNDVTAKLTIDDLVVRKRLSVHELLINQIRATNGALFISSVGRIYSASFDGNSIYSLFFDTGSAGSRFAHGFEIGDLILAQRIDPTVTTTPTYVNGRPQEVIYRSEMFVTQYLSSGSIKAVLSSGTTAPQPGFDYVRIGNAASLNGNYTKPDRQGTVYLTSDDQYSPYIDVVDGVVSHNEWFDSSKVKVRIGKLDGITDTISSFGNLSGYGFWASGSAYLEGGINATVGKIGGFTISTDTIVDSSTNEKLILRSNGDITGSQVYFDGGVVGGFSLSTNEITSIDTTSLVLKSSGDITGSKVLFTGGKISGSNLSIDVTNLIAKGNSVEISGSNFHLLNGNVTASNVDLSGKITATTGKIGGFEITEDAITGSNFYLSGSATDNDFFISSSKFNVKANGDVTGSQVLFTGGKISGSNLSIDVQTLVAKGDSVEISGSNFHLLQGNITASNVDLSGKISAETGSLGNLDISGSVIVNQGGSVKTVNAINSNSGSGFYLDNNGNFFFGNTDSQFFKYDGDVIQISGSVNADSGRIGSWKIDNFGKLESSNNRIIIDGESEEIRVIDSENIVRFITNTNTTLPNISANDGTLNPSAMTSSPDSIQQVNPSGFFKGSSITTVTQSYSTNFTVSEQDKGDYSFTLDFDGTEEDLAGSLYLKASGVSSKSEVVVRLVVEDKDGNKTFSNSITTIVEGQEQSIFGTPIKYEGVEVSRNTLNSGLLSLNVFMTGSQDPYKIYTQFDRTVSIIAGTNALNSNNTNYILSASVQTDMENGSGVNEVKYSLTPSYTVVNGGGFQSVIDNKNYLKVFDDSQGRVSTEIVGGLRIGSGLLANNETGSAYIKFQAPDNSAAQFNMWNNNGALVVADGILPDNSQISFIISSSGQVDIPGTLTKGGGSFKIPHPISELSSSLSLVHSFIEGPKADLIYRGTVKLVSGSSKINIDKESNMTEGTFQALTTNIQCFTSNETSWDAVRGKVENNILTIECQNTESTDTISWIVIGERDDNTIKNLTITDENGRIVVEVPR